MPIFRQGDVVRVPFPYTARNTRQYRPALVVSQSAGEEAAALIWVVMITSAANRRWADDVSLETDFREAGLPAPSVIRPVKIATIDAAMADRVGEVPPQLLAQVMGCVLARLGASGAGPLSG